MKEELAVDVNYCVLMVCILMLDLNEIIQTKNSWNNKKFPIEKEYEQEKI